MNGFDFDALRDPVAPDPGARQRAGVAGRARELRGRARRARLLAGAASFVAVAVIAGGVVALTRGPGPSITVANPSTTLTPTTTPTTYGPSVDSRFIPPTTVENGLVVLPVTLPDGESFTMKYPPAMKIAQLGFGGGADVGGKQVSISYTTIQHTYGGSPITTFPGANGGAVSLFHANQRSGYVGPDVDELAYQFGKWVAIVEAPAAFADQQQWAKNLSGTTDSNGYLVLAAGAPLKIGYSFDGGFGKVPGNALELASHLYCGQPGSDTSTRRLQTNGDGSKFVSWCDGALHVTADGSSTFLDQAANELQIVPATAPESTPTTTTTTPAEQASPAVSASFVSPDQGFVLEQNGRVDATSDGGTTWTVAGSLPSGDWRSGRIRFIGPSDGFAFVPGNGPLMITHDAGATWTTVHTPFTNVWDLSILNGMIAAVGTPAKVAGSFGIWSTPVAHLVWKRDPYSLSIGGGPVPDEQIVLSGTGGWILGENRTVVAGARLGPNNRWTSWSPPCSGKNGPAYLAASTATDLFASCDEGVWGPPAPAHTVYVSHDAGNTFTRHIAPGFGPIAAANPTTAIIGGNGTLFRTTDGGATWNVVEALRDASATPSDLGFTTPTQGFVILADQSMLITHDAGATWQRVTLP